MERDPLNLFQPFEHLAPNHENQLTRALLVVLRLSPMAHVCWLARVVAERRLPKRTETWRLPDLPSPAEFSTQQRLVRTPQAQDPDEGIPLVSVFLAPKEPLGEDTVISVSDRTQVLDAVIEYPGALVVVVENKVVEAGAEQARSINTADAGVQISEGEQLRVVEWPALLADLTHVLERGLVAGAEASILRDFLDYADDFFPGLGPYQTLRLCRDNESRITRRLRALLSEARGQEARIDKWGSCVELPERGEQWVASRVYLRHEIGEDRDVVELAVYPADTLSQARAFYSQPERVAAVRALMAQTGWVVAPNFHFGHMQAGYAWCWGGIETERYLDVWQDRIDRTSQLRRDEWPAFWEWLISEQIADPQTVRSLIDTSSAPPARRQVRGQVLPCAGDGRRPRPSASMAKESWLARSAKRWRQC